MHKAGRIVGALIIAAGFGPTPAATAYAATSDAAIELSPDMRPALILVPPQGALQLVHRATRLRDQRAQALPLKLGSWLTAPITRRDARERHASLPAGWLTTEPDRGFTQALLGQLSHVAANWPWRTLIVSSSAAESDSQLQTLGGQSAVVAVVQDELVDLAGKVELHVTMNLVTVRNAASAHETRVQTPVEYFAPALAADSALPRRNATLFALNGALDEQVSTAATDLTQFLATMVARFSVPASLHARNPTLGELGLHPTCAECRASDRVVYQQPGRVWVKVGKPPGGILALPLKQTSRTSAPAGHTARSDNP